MWKQYQMLCVNGMARIIKNCFAVAIRVMLHTSSADILQNSWSHLKTSRRQKGNMKQVPQILDTTAQNSVAQVTWHQGFVQPWSTLILSIADVNSVCVELHLQFPQSVCHAQVQLYLT